MMKQLLSILAVAVISAATVNAQGYTVESVTIGSGVGNLTNVVPAATSNSSMAVYIALQKFKSIGISWQFKLAGAGTTAVELPFYETVDGSNFSPEVRGTLVGTPTGTLTVNTITNFNFANKGIKGIKFTTIRNPSAAILTNLQFDVSYKDADN